MDPLRNESGELNTQALAMQTINDQQVEIETLTRRAERAEAACGVMRKPLEELWRRWTNEPTGNQGTVVSYVWSSTGEQQMKAALATDVGDSVAAELAKLREENEKLRWVAQMALDSLTLSADDYERKYYPLAGPATLVYKLTDALKEPPHAT